MPSEAALDVETERELVDVSGGAAAAVHRQREPLVVVERRHDCVGLSHWERPQRANVICGGARRAPPPEGLNELQLLGLQRQERGGRLDFRLQCLPRLAAVEDLSGAGDARREL